MPRALQRHQPVEAQRVDLGEGGLDARAGIDRDGHERQVLGEGEQPVGAEVLLRAEALDAAHQQARLQVVAGVHGGQGVGEEPAVDAVALAEVDRQLQGVVAHSAAPSSRPAQATS